MTRTRSWSAFVLAVIFACVLAVYLAGCSAAQRAALDQTFPNDKGNVPAQVALTIQAATTQPSVQAAVGTFPYGDVALGVVGLLSGLAAYFARKAHGAASTAADNTASLGVTVGAPVTTPKT